MNLNLILVILVIIAAIMFPLVLLGAIWEITPFCPMKRLCHDILGWHKPGKRKDDFLMIVDGRVILASRCKVCGEIITADYTGDWMEI